MRQDSTYRTVDELPNLLSKGKQQPTFKSVDELPDLKKKEPSEPLSKEPSDGGLDGTIPTITQDELDKQDDVIGKIQEADALSKKTRFWGMGGGGGEVPDFDAIAKSKEIHNQLKGMGYGDNDIDILTKTFSDLPKEAEQRSVKQQDGTVAYPYSKKSFLELYKSNPIAAVTKANNVKNFYELRNVSGEGKASEYNSLAYVNDETKPINVNIDNFNQLKERQKELINTSLPKEKKQKALDRVEENSDIILSDIFQDEDNAKNYLIGKLQQKDATLKLSNPTVMEAEGKVDGDLSKFSLESIAENLDPKNKAEKLAFRKYKYTVDLDNALNSSADFNQAAVTFAAEQNPQIKGQIEKLGGTRLPNAYEGEIVNEFLNSPDVISRAEQDPEFAERYSQAKNNLYFNYPEFAKKEVATKISQAMEDRGMTNWFANIPTKEGTDKLVDDLVRTGKLTEQDKLVYDKQIRDDLGVWQSVKRGVGRIPFGAFIEESPIQTPGLLESTQNAFNKTIHGVARSVEDVINIPAGGEAFSAKERLYNKLQEDASLVNLIPKSTLHEVSMGTGHLAGFVIPMMAGGAALRGVKGAEFISNGLIFEGENKSNALKLFPDNPTKQYAYTAIATAGDMMLGHLIPKGDAAKGISKTLKGDIVDVVNKFTNKEITAAQAKQTLLNKTTSLLGDLAKENTKVAGTITGFGVFHNTLDALFGANNMSAGDISTQAVKDFKSTFLTTPVLAAMAVKGRASGINGKVLMEVASNPELYKKVIAEQSALNPELKSTEKERLQNLEDAALIKKDLDNTEMNDKQKEEFMVTAINKKILERKAAGITDKTLKQSVLDQAEKHDTNLVLLKSEFGDKEFKDLTPEERDRIEPPKDHTVKTQPSGTEGKFTPVIINKKGEHEVLNKSFDTPEAAKVYGEETVKKRYFDENIKNKEEELPDLSQPIPELNVDNKGIPLTEIAPEEIQRQMQPITDRMAEIEREFENKGFKIDWDYDNEIQVTDKKGNQLEAEEIPTELHKIAAEYEKATSKLGEFSQSDFVKSLEQSRKRSMGEEVPFKEVGQKQISKPTDVVGSEKVEGGEQTLSQASNPTVQEGSVGGDVKRDISQFANENESYRVIVGDEAFNDIIESGVVRTNADSKSKKDGGIDLSNRPTAFPSFSRGKASIEYAAENPNNYIIVTEDASIQPSKSGRHGKGTTMFPTDENGDHLKELDGKKVKVYKHIGEGKYELVYANGKAVEQSLSTPKAEPQQSGKDVVVDEGVKPDTFENREKIEEALKEFGNDVYYHGSSDISYLSSVGDISTETNTKNAESKYVNLTPKSGTAVSYSIRQQKIGDKSGVAAFKLNGKKYVMKDSDIKSLKTNADYEAFYDKKKLEGYDYVEVPQDAKDIVVLNNSALELVGKKFNRDSLSTIDKGTETQLGNEKSTIVSTKEQSLSKQESGGKAPVTKQGAGSSGVGGDVEATAKKIVGESAFDKLKKEGYTIEKGKFDSDAYASFFGLHTGVQADEFANAGLRLVKPSEKIKVYRGKGKNVSEGENEGVTWVAEDKKVAENYSNDGNVEEIEVTKPKNPFPNPTDTIHVKGSDVGNKLKGILNRLFREGKVTKEQAIEASKAIDEFVLAAGEESELYSTKTNKKGVSSKYVKALQALGFDGIVQKESYNSGSPFTATKTGNETNTYGIFKAVEQSLSTPKAEPQQSGKDVVVDEGVGKPKDFISDMEGKGFKLVNGEYQRNGVGLSIKRGATVLVNKSGDVIYADSPKETDIVLKEIKVIDEAARGKGEATKALNDFLESADQQGYTIYIEPTPIKRLENKNNLTKDQLIKWYEKNGFEKSNNDIWIRKPKEIKNEKEVTQDTKSTEKTGNAEGVVSKGVSEAGGAKEPPKEPAEPVGEEGSKKDGITHAAVEELRKIIGEPEYEGKPVENHETLIEEAQKKIKENPNAANEVLDKMENNGKITNKDNAVIAIYKATIDAEIAKNPTPELLKRATRLVKALDVSGTELGKALESRKLVGKEDSLTNFLLDKQAAQGTALTEKQVKDEAAKYTELKAAKEALEKQLEQEREQHAKDIAELGINKAKAKAKREAKKSDEEYRAERKASVDAAREALKKLREGGLKSTIPGALELQAIAPHVKDFFNSLASQGVDKLDNIITQVHAEFKDVLDGLTKKNILDIVAGDFDQKKEKTKNEKTANIRLLKREVDLLKELERARKGEEKAKSETEKVSANRRIDELKKKIEEVQKLHKEKEDIEPVEDLSAGSIEDVAKYEAKLQRRIEKLNNDLKEGNYLKEPAKQPIFKKTRKAQILEDRVIDLENKIRHERSKDEYNKRSKTRKAFDKLMEVLGIKRLVQTALDMSTSFRQGATLLSPRQIDVWAKGFQANLQSIFSPKKFERIMYEIRHDQQYHEMMKDNVVFNDLGSADPNLHNEDFRKSFVYKIPLLSEPLKASNRSADAFLNVARYELYKKLRRNLESKGFTREADPKSFKYMGNWVMSMTGRGKMHSALEKPAMNAVLGNTFFGARLMASRFNLLNPVTYFDPRIPKEVRYEAMKDMVAFTTTMVTVATALSYTTGAKISLNPDDSDFLQLRYDDKVYDISGGLANYVRTGLRILKAGYTKATGTKYEGKEATKNAGQSVLNFFRNKLSPNTAYGVDAFFGGRYGEQFDPRDIYEIYPMYTDDFLKAIKEEGGVMATSTVLIPNILGIGYGSYASKGQIDKNLDDLLKRNLRSDEMNNEKIYNYNEGGRAVTLDEFEKFADKRDAEIEKDVKVLYNKGVGGTKYEDLTPEQVADEIKYIKATATRQVKEELFGKEKKSRADKKEQKNLTKEREEKYKKN